MSDIAWALVGGSGVIAGAVVYAACIVAQTVRASVLTNTEVVCQHLTPARYEPPKPATNYSADRRGPVNAPQKVR